LYFSSEMLMSYNMLCIEDPSNTTFSGSDANHNSRVTDTILKLYRK